MCIIYFSKDHTNDIARVDVLESSRLAYLEGDFIEDVHLSEILRNK